MSISMDRIDFIADQERFFRHSFPIANLSSAHLWIQSKFSEKAPERFHVLCILMCDLLRGSGRHVESVMGYLILKLSYLKNY